MIKSHLDKFKPGRTIGTTELAHKLGLDPKLVSRLKTAVPAYVSETGETKKSFGNIGPVYEWHAPRFDQSTTAPAAAPELSEADAMIVAAVKAHLAQNPEQCYGTAEMFTAALGRTPTQPEYRALERLAHGPLQSHWRRGPPMPGSGRQANNPMVRRKLWSASPQNAAERARSDIALIKAQLARAEAALAEAEKPNAANA